MAAVTGESGSEAPRGGHLKGPWSRCGPRTESGAWQGHPGSALGRMCSERTRQPRPEQRLVGMEEREQRQPKPTRATQRAQLGMILFLERHLAISRHALDHHNMKLLWAPNGQGLGMPVNLQCLLTAMF